MDRRQAVWSTVRVFQSRVNHSIPTWSLVVTMKQFAVRSLGWGLAMSTLVSLPVLASQKASAVSPLPASPLSADDSALSEASFSSDYSLAQSEPQLLAVSLSRRSLQQGDQGADVRVLQRYLSRNGLYPFVIDGVYGQETANAVATYQRIRDLPATGVADETTLTDMEFDFSAQPIAASSNTSVPQGPSGNLLGGNLGPGSSGSDVIALQQRLNTLGIPVFVDGSYGFETQQAVRTYQRVQGLDVTGNADSATLRAMGFSAVARYRYVAAVIADESQLADVRAFFPDAYIDTNRRGRFINIGGFDERFPAEARTNAAAARGFNARVLYR